jgi:biopolymer transport protein ExbB
MENVNLDFFHLIHQGAISTYPLIACSIVVLGIAIERMVALYGTLGSVAALTARIVPPLERGDVQGAAALIEGSGRSPARRIYGDLLGALPGASHDDLERIADERQFEEAQGAGAYLWMLGTIGSAAPFIGLFGTVIGIIRAFHSMAMVGTGGFAVVAGGISEALIATALGLAIGIVAVVCYNYFQSRVERIDAALRIGSARLLEAVATARRANGVR